MKYKRFLEVEPSAVIVTFYNFIENLKSISIAVNDSI